MSNDDLEAAVEIENWLESQNPSSSAGRAAVLARLAQDTHSDATRRIATQMAQIAQAQADEETFQLYVADQARKAKRTLDTITPAEVAKYRLAFQTRK